MAQKFAAGVAAAKAVKANPEKSDHVIAKDIGVASNTVREARKSVTRNSVTEPARRIGKDGKNYPATKPLSGAPLVRLKSQQRIFFEPVAPRRDPERGRLAAAVNPAKPIGWRPFPNPTDKCHIL